MQILRKLVVSAYSRASEMVAQPKTDPGKEYALLKVLFTRTKMVYDSQAAFLDAKDLGFNDGAATTIIRKANLATFVCGLFGSQDVGFYHLNKYFLAIIAPEGVRLWKVQGTLFLELKTQAYISALAAAPASKAKILEEMFPAGMEKSLRARRFPVTCLVTCEVDLVSQCQRRREALSKMSNDRAGLEALHEKYVWDHFLRTMIRYICRNLNGLTSVSRIHASVSRILACILLLTSRRCPPIRFMWTSTMLLRQPIQKKPPAKVGGRIVFFLNET